MQTEHPLDDVISKFTRDPESLDYIELDTSNNSFKSSFTGVMQEIVESVHKHTGSYITFKLDGKFYDTNQSDIVQYLESCGYSYISECVYNQVEYGFCDTYDYYVSGPIYIILYHVA